MMLGTLTLLNPLNIMICECFYKGQCRYLSFIKFQFVQ